MKDWSRNYIKDILMNDTSFLDRVAKRRRELSSSEESGTKKKRKYNHHKGIASHMRMHKRKQCKDLNKSGHASGVCDGVDIVRSPSSTTVFTRLCHSGKGNEEGRGL